MKSAATHERETPAHHEARLAAAGMSNEEISSQLVLSPNTVKYHLHSIYEKLSVPDRRSAVQFARLNNYL